MEKVIFMQPVTKCGEVNLNGVMYSKDTFEKALDNAFNNNPRGIPVTFNSPIYNSSVYIPPEEFTLVRQECVIGYVESKDMVHFDTEIGIFPKNEQSFYIIKTLKEKNYKLGIRYLGNVNILSDSVKETKNMKIIAFNILPPSTYNQTDWDK